MPAVKAALAALLLLAAPQAAAHPDTLAELFPEDALVFAEVSGLADLARDWRTYAEAYLPAPGRKEALDGLEKAMTEGLRQVPERLMKDLEKLVPALRRSAVGVWMDPAAGPQVAGALSASDPALLKRIVEEGLKPFAADERPQGGSTLLLLRRIGDLSLGKGVWIGAAGTRLVLAPDGAAVARMLDRAAGKPVPGGDLRGHAAYKSFAAAPDGPSVRASWTGFATIGDLAGGFGRGQRSSAHEMDKVNAVFGLDKIGAFLLEASLRPGRIASTARLRMDGPCALYDVWRQPAGPKETLAFVPPDAGLVAHVNASSGKDVWAGIETLMRRYDAVNALTLPPGGRPRRTVKEEVDRDLEREFGLPPARLFGAIADEAAFALAGPDAFAFDGRMLNAILFVVKATDPAEARDVLRAILGRQKNYEEKEQDGVLWWRPGQGAREAPIFALQGRMCLIGFAAETLEAALAAAKAGSNVAGGLPPEAAAASKLLRADLGGFWKGLVPRIGGELPPEARGLAVEGRSWIFFEEKPEELRLKTSDGGVGLAVQGGVMLMPLLILSEGPRRHARMEEVEAPAAPAPAAAPLPAEEVAATVKALVADMQADDVVKREEAVVGLRALGPQAIPAMVAAIQATSDAETRGRLLDQLVKWNAYDAMPEVLARKVESFLADFRRAPTARERALQRAERTVNWYRHEGSPWPHSLEPHWVNETALRKVPHVDVLQYAAGAKAAAEAATGERLPLESRKSLASLLAFLDCGKAGATLVAARDGARDPDVKVLLQIALGWSDDPACRKAVLDGLTDGDAWIRRASFIAAERTSDPELVGRLVELLSSKDAEIRWNAGYTLGVLTKRKIRINVYAPEAEVEAAVGAAGAWWASNKATFKPGR